MVLVPRPPVLQAAPTKRSAQAMVIVARAFAKTTSALRQHVREVVPQTTNAGLLATALQGFAQVVYVNLQHVRLLYLAVITEKSAVRVKNVLQGVVGAVVVRRRYVLHPLDVQMGIGAEVTQTALLEAAGQGSACLTSALAKPQGVQIIKVAGPQLIVRQETARKENAQHLSAEPKRLLVKTE